MLYIVRVFEDGNIYEYEHGNIEHASEQYAQEKTAKLTVYHKGIETILRNKVNGRELEV